MNENDYFESELRRVKPAEPPPELLSRLRGSMPCSLEPAHVQVSSPVSIFWRQLLRLLLPATAVAALAFFVWQVGFPGSVRLGGKTVSGAAAGPSLKADDVQIDRELVGSFDAVARLPGGEPVRFRCREWVDQVTWSDKERGVTVEQRAPRIEVIPVRFETY